MELDGLGGAADEAEGYGGGSGEVGLVFRCGVEGEGG